MRPSKVLLVSIGLLAALPALAESAADAPAVVVLRGSSAPAPAAPPPEVVQTVVYLEIVYVPTYDPAYTFYPGYFIQPQRFMRHRFSATGMSHDRK
jgi:hypothetical protein